MRLQELNPDTPWLLAYLRMIRERPPIYLGDFKVYTLDQWLHGYVTAREDLGIDAFVGEEVGLLNGFTHWLAVKLPTTISCQWAGIIHHKIDSSDRNVETFFRLFDEYRDALATITLVELEESYKNLIRFRP